ncbi:MAG: NAD-dependent epimerase/dehydratase family protein [Candidatus Aminicenantales bacterium]
MSPKALVTGATGFIGSYLTEALIRRGWKTTCLVRETSRTDFLQKLPVSFLFGDADDLESLEKAVKGMDYVFHSAGQIRPVSREIYDKANHRFTRNLILACVRANPHIKRFVYISSISAAGPSLLNSFADESPSCHPSSEYGRSKLRGELAVREHWSSVPATIIRPPNVFGRKHAETEIIIKIIKRRMVPLLRERGKMISLIYIKDLVEGIIKASLSPRTESQVYYLTDGGAYSWREVILTLKKYILGNSLFFFPIPESIIYFSAWLADFFRKVGVVNIFFGRKMWNEMVRTAWLFSPQKAKRDFGFQAEFDLDKGVQDLLKFYD